MASGEDDDVASEGVQRCDYCRLPIPKTPVEREFEGEVYAFCSEACRSAQEENDRVFTEYHGYRRFRPGVSALESSLPQGIPRNSFVMFTDLAGTRTEAIQAELVWRALQRGEPVIFVSFLEPPVSVIQEFATLEWNVLPYLEEGQLHILDCFTYRVDDRDRMYDRMNSWNAHLSEVAEQATTRVRDPSETAEVGSRLDRALENKGMHDEGIVVFDSLTEFGSLVQPVQAYNFVKDIRADVCKGRFVPIFAGATLTTDEETFPHDLKYMADGIVEMRLNEEIVDGALVKQIRVRKMSGVLIYPEWSVYEYTSGKGIVTFDPIEEMEKSKAARGELDGDADQGETPSPAGSEAEVDSRMDGAEAGGEDGGSGGDDAASSGTGAESSDGASTE